MQKLRCPNCGKTLRASSGKNNRINVVYLYYNCNKCNHNQMISEIKLEQAFIKRINAILDTFLENDIELLPIQDNSVIESETRLLEEQKERIITKIKNIKDLYVDQVIDREETDKRLTENNKILKEIDIKIDELREQDIRLTEDFDIEGYATRIEVEELKEKSYCIKAENIWNKISQESKQLLIAEFIDYIEIETETGKKINLKKLILLKLCLGKILSMIYLMDLEKECLNKH